MQYSDAGLALTRAFEALRFTAYQDGGGVWTIGYGHTGRDVYRGCHISQDEAEQTLRWDMRAAVDCVNASVHVPLTQGQFDALVDFTFNAGRGNFLRSTLLAKVNAGDFAGAAAEFGKWVNVNGQPERGLIRRRAAEAALFEGKTPELHG